MTTPLILIKDTEEKQCILVTFNTGKRQLFLSRKALGKHLKQNKTHKVVKQYVNTYENCLIKLQAYPTDNHSPEAYE